MNQLQSVRHPDGHDEQYIYDLDVKCFDDVWTKDQWDKIQKNPKAKVWLGCVHNTPVSLIVVEEIYFKPPDSDRKVRSLHIHKLCVKNPFRNRGNGTRMLAHIETQAVREKAQWVTATVPEWLTDSSDKRNCLKFITKYGFKAIRTLPNPVSMYGQKFDQYLFAKEIINE